MNNLMECDRCRKKVEETTTSSCSVGHFEIPELIPDIGKDRLRKLCSFDDLFFCKDCMHGNVCRDCAQILSPEELEIIESKV